MEENGAVLLAKLKTTNETIEMMEEEDEKKTALISI